MAWHRGFFDWGDVVAENVLRRAHLGGSVESGTTVGAAHEAGGGTGTARPSSSTSPSGRTEELTFLPRERPWERATVVVVVDGTSLVRHNPDTEIVVASMRP